MGCPCKDKKKAAEAKAESSVPARQPEMEATSVRLEFVVRGEGHPLACEECLKKHLGAAFVLSTEAAEEFSRQTERLLCIANLRCAEEHARALGREGLGNRLAMARVSFAKNGVYDEIATMVNAICGEDDAEKRRLVAIGHVAAAEQMLRLCGGGADADRLRAVRLDISGDKEGSES